VIGSLMWALSALDSKAGTLALGRISAVSHGWKVGSLEKYN
jgi:hypothetical protein